MENDTNAHPPIYAALSDAELINLMFTGADRLPMEFAREVIARGTRMIAPMAGIIAEPENWERGDAGWCAVLHSVFLTGAIGGKEAVKPLIDAIFPATETSNYWITEALPSIFGRVGLYAADELKTIARNPAWDWFTRNTAFEGLGAIALNNPEFEPEALSFLAAIAADKKEDPEGRVWAGQTLLDFGKAEHKELLLELVDTVVLGREFDRDDVEKAASGKTHFTQMQKDWLSFYSTEEIAARQKRWKEEARGGAEEPESDGPPAAQLFMRERHLAAQALAPYAELLSAVIKAIITPESDLKQQYELAMELTSAIRQEEAKTDETSALAIFKRLGGDPADSYLENDMVPESSVLRIFADALGHYDLYDWLNTLPLTLADAGLTREGAALAKRWQQIWPDNDDLLEDLPVILAEAGFAAEAREQAQKNLADPDVSVWSRIKAGDTFNSLKDFPAAEAHYRKALETASDKDEREGALERLVPLLRELGRKEEAEKLIIDASRRAYAPKPPVFPETERAPKIGRNVPCPCGSGKKYKKCCGG